MEKHISLNKHIIQPHASGMQIKTAKDALNFHAIMVRPVLRAEEGAFNVQMQMRHYLGALSKIGESRVAGPKRFGAPHQTL